MTSIKNLILLLGIFATAHGQQIVVTNAHAEQVFDNYLKGVAFSCAQSVVQSKAEIIDTVLKSRDAFEAWEDYYFEEAPGQSQAQSEVIAKKQAAWEAQKRILMPALKKLALVTAAYALLVVMQNRIPQASLYHSESTKEFMATFVAPMLISQALSKGAAVLCPQKKSRLLPWLLFFLNSCISYFATVQVHAYFQPYTMPSLSQHMFNFTGNHLAPGLCVQLVC